MCASVRAARWVHETHYLERLFYGKEGKCQLKGLGAAHRALLCLMRQSLRRSRTGQTGILLAMPNAFAPIAITWGQQATLRLYPKHAVPTLR